LNDCEALRESEALKTLSTELYIVKDLPINGFLEEGGWEGPHTRFDLSTKMGRAIGVGSPNNSHGE